MSKEYRRNRRVKPIVNIDIVDFIIGISFGEVLNVSRDGLLMACNKSIEVGDVFQTDWIFNSKKLKDISVGLECLWGVNQNTNFCLCGFHIIDISEKDQAVLDRLISQSKEID